MGDQVGADNEHFNSVYNNSRLNFERLRPPRDESVSSVFVDAVASQFLLKSREGSVEGAVVKRHVYTPSTGDCLAQSGYIDS